MFPSHIRSSIHGRFAAFLGLLGLWSLVAPCQAGAADPPGVARVGFVEGPASYSLRGEEEWIGVDVNAPLVTGDRFYAGEGARAELQLAAGTHARLGSGTQIDLVELAQDATQVRVVFGSAILRLRDTPRRQHVELDTPAAAFVLMRAGDYRVDVDPHGETTLRIRRGEVVAHFGDARRTLVGPTTIAFAMDSPATPTLVATVGAEDELDLWDLERTARIERAQSYRYVSTEIYGAEDLDEHGVWEYHTGYGRLWRPTSVAVGWAPYRDGRWVWVEPWGWTWLDYASWGWAPFHYGRWVRLNQHWYWGPGTVIARPTYAPALVGFYGSVGSVSVSIGVGGYVGASIGWVPLGWGEPCFPWWGGFGGARIGTPWWGGWGGPRIVNNVYVKQQNFYDVRVRDMKHVNRRHPGGFTTMPRKGFGRGGGLAPGSDREGRAFRPVGGRIGLEPDRLGRQAVRPGRAAIGDDARPPRAPGRQAGNRGSVTSPRPGRSIATDSRNGAGAVRSVVAGGRDVVRPPTRVATSPAPSAPRTFARRSEPHVARRPSFPASDSPASSRRSSGSFSTRRSPSIEREMISGRSTGSSRSTAPGRPSGSGRSTTFERSTGSSRSTTFGRSSGSGGSTTFGRSSESGGSTTLGRSSGLGRNFSSRTAGASSMNGFAGRGGGSARGTSRLGIGRR